MSRGFELDVVKLDLEGGFIVDRGSRFRISCNIFWWEEKHVERESRCLRKMIGILEHFHGVVEKFEMHAISYLYRWSMKAPNGMNYGL